MPWTLRPLGELILRQTCCQSELTQEFSKRCRYAGLHACSGQVVAAAYHDALPQPGGTSSHTPSLEAECSASHASHARVGEGHVLRAHRVRNVQASIIRHYLRGDTCNHVSQSSPSGLTTSNAIAFYRDGLGFKTDGR